MTSRIKALIALAGLALGCGEEPTKERFIDPPSPKCESVTSDDPSGGLPLKGDCNSPFYDMIMAPRSGYGPEGAFHFHKSCVIGFYDEQNKNFEFNDAPRGFVYEARNPKTTYQGLEVKKFPVPDTEFTIDATFKRMVITCEPRHHTQTRTTEDIYILIDLGFTLLDKETAKRIYEH